jgi:hypothetical protein
LQQNARGNHSRRMTEIVDLIQKLWPAYFPQDPFNKLDKRIDAVKSFQSLILTNGDYLVGNLSKLLRHGYVELDMVTLQQIFSFPDFVPTLRSQPNEVLGCLVCKSCELSTSCHISHSRV